MNLRRLRILPLAMGLFWGLGLFGEASVAAQSASGPTPERQPRAQSEQEFEAYQRFRKETNPDQQIQLIEDFLLEYPNTELKEFAFQTATQAYQAKNDYERLLTYGELTLAENPDNLVALMILSSALPERTERKDPEREEKLADAESYAKRALEVLARMSRPEHLSEEEWKRAQQDAEATPHAALGLIAMIREDLIKAEWELKKAVELASRPDPVTLYRLGLCYSLQKKFDLALETLERASGLGGVRITTLEGTTRDLVAEARDFVRKAKASEDAPVSEPQAGTLPPTEAGATP
ncbi:MAG: tetratricopeptide repeat protein [Acidobacteria bacterium]|nr:tetratricopeptide repeat protein [Acidobacteriota bacterium]